MRRLVQLGVTAAGIAALMGQSAATAGSVGASPIKAVVVKSWGQCAPNDLVWNTLNMHWSDFGTTPISIAYNDRDVCGTHFTLAGLEASGAQVVIISDPAGRSLSFSPSEITALTTYAAEGHEIVGTFLTLSYKGIDNTGLAPLFGLRPDAGWMLSGPGPGRKEYTVTTTDPTYLDSLFRNLSPSWLTTGYRHQSQVPGSGAWTQDAMAGASILARNGDGQGAVTLYQTDAYSAIFIADMPEYSGSTSEQQLLYNAIVYPSSS